jgi:molecular chaperone GrpE
MPHSIEDEAIATEAADIGTLLAENASLRDRLLRALAEAENTRRRLERSAEDVRKYAIADFARELLVVVDNLQRTIAAAEGAAASTTEGAALVEGVRATLRVLMRVMERFDVRPIAALGQRFDPRLHEAVMEVDDPTQPPGTVTQVVEDGYIINERLLRPARVVVSKRPAGAAPAPEDEEAGREPPGLSRGPNFF